MKKLSFLFLLFAITCSFPVLSQPKTPFSKGVNLTNWFQASGPKAIQFTKFTKKDFKDIQSLGCDVIRLPINLHSMTNGEPDYILDTLFLSFLDQAVDWAEESNMYLILDNHTFDPIASTQPSVEGILIKVWAQLAEHYKNRSELILYEILNEPHGISTEIWSPIQQHVIDTIRSIDTKHTIIVGPVDYNSFHKLDELPVYTDTNLIYTFHFYDPFVFTHQGATWVDPSMAPLAGVPFPYNGTEMLPVPASLQGTWVGSALSNYKNDGTVAKIKSLIDIAANFQSTRNVPVFCGEFGVYIPNSNNDDRVEWYREVRQYLENKNIGWTIWDYKGGFGLFEKGSAEIFENDLNVPLLEALDFNVPEQGFYKFYPDTTGFIIYDDYPGTGIMISGGTPSGIIDLYTSGADSGKFCIKVSNVGQYDALAFDFQPDKDLHLLKENDYRLEFSMKWDAPDIKYDVRFLDTDAGGDDIPWRMGITLDKTMIPQDEEWHHFKIDLSNLSGKGGWDGTWHSPPGNFDWKAVDRLEFVPESQPLTDASVWFDNIRIAGEATIIKVSDIKQKSEINLRYDRISGTLIIDFPQIQASAITLNIYTLQGTLLWSKNIQKQEVSDVFTVAFTKVYSHQILLYQACVPNGNVYSGKFLL